MQHVRRAPVPPAAAFTLLTLTCSGLAAWRLLAWRSLESPDALAYTVWGQALARGDAPPFDRTTTIPKPLGALIGLLVSPLPPQRAFGLAIALAAGLLVAAAFAAGWRAGGAPAAFVAAAAVAFLPRLGQHLAGAAIDCATAALLVLALALRGRRRIAANVLAGLVRPEAWLLAALAGYTETAGSRRRRLLLGAAAGALPVAAWLAASLVMAGDPLVSLGRARDLNDWRPPHPWSALPGLALTSVRSEAGLGLALAGAGGLVAFAVRERRAGRVVDVLPLAAVPLSLAVLMLEYRRLPESSRYALPAAAVLAVGCGYLVAALPLRRLAGALPAAAGGAAAAAALAAALVLASPPAPDTRSSGYREQALVGLLPQIQRALACGPVHIDGTRQRGVATAAAALTRRPIGDFPTDAATGDVAAHLGSDARLPRGWRRTSRAPYAIAVEPRCPPTATEQAAG